MKGLKGKVLRLARTVCGDVYGKSQLMGKVLRFVCAVGGIRSSALLMATKVRRLGCADRAAIPTFPVGVVVFD